MIAEPDVALTDYALAVESFLFSAWIHGIRASSSLRFWFVVLFGSIGMAAFVGGTVHGFLTDPQTRASSICWMITMIVLGISALSEYGIAARILLAPRPGNVAISAAVLTFALYVAIVVAWNATFRIAVIDYIGGLIFLVIAFVRLYVRDRSRPAFVGLVGLLLTVGASITQQTHISIHPRYFNHNALYHLLEGIALFLIYCAARSAVRTTVHLENR
jgi:hypothetical protein